MAKSSQNLRFGFEPDYSIFAKSSQKLSFGFQPDYSIINHCQLVACAEHYGVPEAKGQT